MAKYAFWETVWWATKRFLRTVVPQVPALLAWSGTVFPPEWVPYLVAVGGFLTVLDKMVRDSGGYTGIVKRK